MPQPYPSDAWVGDLYNYYASLYTQAGVPIDSGMQIWIGRTLYDIGAGMDKEVSKAKHANELEVVLGINPNSPSSLIPTREGVLGIGIHFRGGLIVNSPTYGKMPWWPPALAWLMQEDRQLVYEQLHIAGDTHCIIEVPNGYPLYDEGNQFYSPTPDKFPALDWTNNETVLDQKFSDLVNEVIEQGFKYIIAMDERVDHSMKIVQLVMNSLTETQLKYGVVIPGYDSVFYGWQPSAIIEWASTARAIKPNCYLGIEFNTGHIPLGNGPADYELSGSMKDYDLILGEFPSPPVGDAVWQIVGRCVKPYNRPPEQIGDNNPPFYLIDNIRGPRYFCAFETNYPYNWVRLDMNNQTAIDNMIEAIENERASFKQLGCRFVS